LPKIKIMDQARRGIFPGRKGAKRPVISALAVSGKRVKMRPARQSAASR
jgi:hypothetical protein